MTPRKSIGPPLVQECLKRHCECCSCKCGDVFAGDVVLLLVVVPSTSIVDNVFGVLSFFLFPFVDVLHSNKPCIFVLQIITLSGLRFFIFHNLIQVAFPSIGWSSCFPLSLCRYDKSRIPLGSFSGPSSLALCGNKESLTLFFSSASFVILFVYSIQFSKSSSWLAVLSSS